MKDIHLGWQDIKRQAGERALDSLYESRLIEARENSDGTLTLVLSEDGRKKALTYRASHIKITHSSTWGKKWWIVLYDIPEHERGARNAFRDHLRRLGFRKLQHSAGIYPFPCKNELDFVIELLAIRRYVRIIEADRIDNEAYWKRIFRLEPVL